MSEYKRYLIVVVASTRNPFGVERNLASVRDITATPPSKSSVVAAMSLKPELHSKRKKLPPKPEWFVDSDGSQDIDQFASQEEHEVDYPSQKILDFDGRNRAV